MRVVTYKNYGKCVEILHEGNKLLVTVEVGPRVIFFGRDGGENLFFEDENDKINLGGEYFDTNFKQGERWHIYGGHRFWKSPEDYGTYAPDNYPVEVTEGKTGYAFTAPTEKMTGIQKTVTIVLNAGGEIEVRHKAINRGGQPATLALWAISVLAAGGTLKCPLDVEDTGWLPNRVLSFWSYTDVADPRLSIKNDHFLVKQDKNAVANFKIGAKIGKGGALTYKNKGVTLCIKPQYVEARECPDFCSNVEVYTSNLMLEVETLSKLVRLKPGEHKTHVEWWRILD